MTRRLHSPQSPPTSSIAATATKVERAQTHYASRALPRIASQISDSTPTRPSRRAVQPQDSPNSYENCGYIDFGTVTNCRRSFNSDASLRKSTRRAAPARSFNPKSRALPISTVSATARPSSPPTAWASDALAPPSPILASSSPLSLGMHPVLDGSASLSRDRAPSPSSSTPSHFADALAAGELCLSPQRATEEQGRYSSVEAFEHDFEDESHPFFDNEVSQFLQQLQANEDGESQFRDDCFAAATEESTSTCAASTSGSVGRMALPQVARKQLALAQSTWSPLESSSTALPLPVRLHHTHFPASPQTRPLALQPSVGTLHAHSPSSAMPFDGGSDPNASFFETPFFDFDIDAILTAYEAVSSDDEDQDEQNDYNIDLNFTPRMSSVKSTVRPDSSKRSVARIRKPIFPSPAQRANPDPRGSQAVFPSTVTSFKPHNFSKLSLQTANLSPDSIVGASPPLPLPAPPAHHASANASASRLSPATAPSRQSTFSSIGSSSNVSSPISTRSSGFSSNGNGSFRWSSASGSTAHTIADGEGLDVFGRCFPSPVKRGSDASVYSTASSVAAVLPTTGPPRRVLLEGANSGGAIVDRRAMACTEDDAMMNWQQFAEEIGASEEDALDTTTPSVAKSSPLSPPPFAFARTAAVAADRPSPASSTSTLPLPGVVPAIDVGPRSLVKKMSSLSLKRFKRSVVGPSPANPPPMPQYASNLVMMHSLHFS
ncbi:BQ5605_C034g11315 [Microbotryum silenes-dioicae]|uniref:BQ5605_C034g11315 protein n=1 Tax=Microbotryum silenes-dioicae TaxID=796604 RepID=A0A2X0N9P2_9BASI|nr:BQ5605_C034g11315 [Microbotryum silenes-dioicae]